MNAQSPPPNAGQPIPRPPKRLKPRRSDQEFLAPALESAAAVAEKVRRTVRELKICMFCLGVKTIAELQRVKLVKGL